MKRQQVLFALRDLAIEALELPPDEEGQASDIVDLAEALGHLMAQAAERRALIEMRRPPPPMRPAVLALAPPKGVPCWVVFRHLPAQGKNVDITSAKAGYPVNPLNLNAGGKTYKLHVGNNFIPVGDWDGVPDELAGEYTSGAITLHQPGEPVPNEPVLLLWSRARSIAYGQDKLSHVDAAKAKPLVEAELARILSKMPKGSGDMYDSVAKLAAIFAPDAPYTGAKNETPAEQKRAARLAAEAKRIARLAGDLPEDVEIAGVMAAAAAPAPAAPRGGRKGTNSFGAPTSQS